NSKARISGVQDSASAPTDSSSESNEEVNEYSTPNLPPSSNGTTSCGSSAIARKSARSHGLAAPENSRREAERQLRRREVSGSRDVRLARLSGIQNGDR